jgi:hypothetical protein
VSIFTGRRQGIASDLGIEITIASFDPFLALPVLSLFSLGQKRGYHIFGVIIWVALVCGLILAAGSPALMYRNLVNCE